MDNITVVNTLSKGDKIFCMIGKAFVYYEIGKVAFDLGKGWHEATKPSKPTSGRYPWGAADEDCESGA